MLSRTSPFFIPLWLLLCGIHTIFTRGNTINCDRARTNYIRIQWSRGTLHGTSDVNRIRHALYCIPAEKIIAVWRLRFAFDTYSLLQRSINNRKIYKRHLILLSCDIIKIQWTIQEIHSRFHCSAKDSKNNTRYIRVQAWEITLKR